MMGRLRLDGSERMTAVFEYIVAHKKANDGIPPTNREIGEHVGEVLDLPLGSLSTSLVSYYLDRLEVSGLIRRLDKKMSRCIVVIGGEWIPPKTA